MIISVPTRVDDKKDAVLWSLFDRLQKIDDTPGSRLAFASGVIFASQVGYGIPLFSSELDQLREVLNIPKPVEEAIEVAPVEVRHEEADPALTMRDDL